jgi:hypothetical protein
VKIRFALLAEGSSDAPLVAHLESLCVRAGASIATGHALNFGQVPNPPKRNLAAQLRWVSLHTTYDLLFIHRDADNPSDERARQTIVDGVRESTLTTLHVPVVPIQELEAWLLLDEDQIRAVAGHPNGRAPLDLPKPKHIERRARPKELLLAALDAARKPGRRALSFPEARRLLLERLDLDGPVNQLTAWQQLLTDIRVAHAQLLLSAPET